jgi:ATP-dependent protease ClpP protease subunit
MPQPWYSIRARASAANAPKAAEVYIFGDIGESWDEETVAAKEFVQNFAAIDALKITVRMSSYGGSVTDGVAIHNAIKRHPAEIAVSIEGAAYSIASLIAMAGDTVEMAENALFMLHAPWAGILGNSVEMREMADVLDRYAEAMASSYVAKSGQSHDEIMTLLTDGKDHWYTAKEALAAGFVDSVTPALQIAASATIPAAALARYPSAAAINPVLQPAAPAASTPTETTSMPNTATPQAAAPAPAMPEAPNAAAILAADKSRRASVRAEFAPFAKHEGIADLQAACEDDHGCTAEAAAKKILAKLAASVQPICATHVETVEDETDKRREVIVATIMAKAGKADAKMVQIAAAGGMRGQSLIDFARASLDRVGIRYRDMDRESIAKAALTQTSGDFPVLLENAMHKVLQAAYATAGDTWARFCAIGSVSDFRAHPRYRVGSLGNLSQVSEGGEYTNVAIPDGEKSSIVARKYGNIIALTTEMIVNDDLGAFMGVAAMQGRAAARTIEATVYALLAENSGLGPTMSDSRTLFHADHGNLTTGAAISVAALDLDRVAMASQADVGGNDFLDLRPSVLLVPLSLGGTARVINDAQYDPDTANKLQRPNMVNGLFSDIVDTPRMTGTRRYLFANPSEAPVIEVAFLDGRREPDVKSEDGFRQDGIEYRVKHVFGAAAIDYRGAVTNAGA